MSESDRQRGEQPGVLHGTTAPLGSALRSVFLDALENVHAAGGQNESLAIDSRHNPVVKDEDVADERASRLDAACEKLTACLKHWENKTQQRDLRQQRVIFHLHPPSNRSEFESWVMGDNMSLTDSALVARLRSMCPKLGFEVLSVVLEYTGTMCHYNGWVFHPYFGGSYTQVIGENGYWKTYQHVKHDPHIYQFKSFFGPALAEEMDCDEGNVVDERNFVWERARRGIFFWQSPDEERDYEEERQARKANPKWYHHIIPGTTADIGKYFAPVSLIPRRNASFHPVRPAYLRLGDHDRAHEHTAGLGQHGEAGAARSYLAISYEAVQRVSDARVIL